MATQETIKQMRVSENGPLRDLEDTTARAGVSALQAALASLQSALNTLMSTDDITDEIDTYNEIKDFLDGFDVNDPTLFNQLKRLGDAITALERAYEGLATVATSGDYRDLNHTPTIPDAQIQSDWSQSDNTKKDFIKNKPDLSGYVTSTSLATTLGSYVTSTSLATTLAGCAGKNGSSSEHFNTDELYVHGDGETVNFYVDLDANDNPVLHISSSNGGDVSIPFGANGLTGQIATKNDLVSMPIVDGSAMANETAKGLSPIVSAAQSITIDAGKYYDFGERPLSGESGLAIFPKEQTEDGSNAYSYVGRFTIDDSFSGTFQFAMIAVRKDSGGNVLEGDETGDFAFKLPDEVEFEAGHTYEFNILYDVCFIKDITVEEGS